MSSVAIHHSNDRAENLLQVLARQPEAVRSKLQRARSVLIKPNLVHHQRQLAVIPGASTAVVIEWIRQLTDAPITVGDASFHDTEDVFTHFGYRALPERFSNVRLLDFNRAPTVPGTLYHAGMRERAVRIAEAVAQADVRIVLSPMKTHNHFIVSLGIKNWTVGIIVAPQFAGTRTWQRWPHFHAQGFRVSHASVVRILKDFPPHLSVLDGWEGMEGDGPTSGAPVPLHLALAGSDPVAVDATAARIMGFNPEDIGYLIFGQRQGLGSYEGVSVVGNATVEQVRRDFKPHPTYRRQLSWRDEHEGRWRSLWSQIARR